MSTIWAFSLWALIAPSSSVLLNTHKITTAYFVGHHQHFHCSQFELHGIVHCHHWQCNYQHKCHWFSVAHFQQIYPTSRLWHEEPGGVGGKCTRILEYLSKCLLPTFKEVCNKGVAYFRMLEFQMLGMRPSHPGSLLGKLDLPYICIHMAYVLGIHSYIDYNLSFVILARPDCIWAAPATTFNTEWLPGGC